MVKVYGFYHEKAENKITAQSWMRYKIDKFKIYIYMYIYHYRETEDLHKIDHDINEIGSQS